MQKLVSKNPILRFKEGNKIRKMQNASGGPLWGKSTEDYRPYFGDEGMLEFNWPINNLKNVSGVVINDAILRHNNTPDIVKVETTPGISIEELQKQSNPTFKNRTTKPQKTNNSFYQFGKMGGWNNSIGIGNITDPESVKMIKEMGLSGSAKDIQNKINEEFGSNAVKSDNKWGNLSKAGLKALYKKWKENLNVVPEPIVRYLSTINPTYTPPTTPINQEVANLNLNVPQQTYDRTGVREFIRNKGINPYSFSGALRRALRMVLNNTADDNDKLLVKGMGLFKQGGQLISRNPIKRFKNGGVLKFQNAGNLPTAPKAEKRYRKSSFNTTKEGNRETTTITSQTFGYNRNWPYFRQPATILRIVEHGDTAFVETPEHHIFTKVLPRTALKSGNTYVEYNPKYDENYYLGGQANTLFNYPVTPLEYETLKRRFNTAWNLTK